MNKILTVAIREFIETVKTKTFLFSSVLLPLGMAGLIFGAQEIADLTEQQQQPTRILLVADETDAVLPALQSVITTYNEANKNRRLKFTPVDTTLDNETLQQRVDEQRANAPPDTNEIAYGYLRITPGALAGEAPVELGRVDNQLRIGRIIEDQVNAAIRSVRFAQSGLDPAQIMRLLAEVDFREIDLTSGEEVTGDTFARLMTPFAFMFFLFMGIMTISQGLLTSVIEEKNSRVMEVLLSAVSPTQLMAGKILGMVSVGVLLLSVWGGVGYAGAQASDLGYLVNAYRLGWLVAYFIPGFLLMAGFLAAVGSVCNTLKEAQSLSFPVTILTIIPMMLWWQISDQPMGILALTLSYIPPITPFVMILRICAAPDISVLELILTQVILWAFVFFIIWAAGRIFRVGVLMYGKAPNPREMLRWFRYA